MPPGCTTSERFSFPSASSTSRARSTDEEFFQIKMHAHVGAEIVGTIPHSDMMREAIEHHHQRFDGSGYPDGLRGEEIPLWARIIGLTDAYANMVTEQSFSAARTPEQALDELANMSGTRFDGMLVRLLLRGLKSERMSSSPQELTPSFSHSATADPRNGKLVCYVHPSFSFRQSCSHLWRFARHWRRHRPHVHGRRRESGFQLPQRPPQADALGERMRRPSAIPSPAI